MLFNAFLLALREIRRNLMRSLLTATGIVIGIASVIAMVNIGKGASESITKSIGELGSNTLFIMPGQERHGPGTQSVLTKPFKMKDVEVLKSSILALEAWANAKPVIARGAGGGIAGRGLFADGTLQGQKLSDQCPRR